MAGMNERLFDASVRNQLFIEGMKAWLAGDFETLVRQFADKVATSVGKLGVSTLDELTAVQFNKLLQELRRDFKSRLDRNEAAFMTWLNKFVKVSYDETAKAYAEISDSAVPALLSAAAVAVLIAKYNRGVVPATGATAAEMSRAANAAGMSIFTNVFRRARVERWTIAQLLTNLLGTRNTMREGAFRSIIRTFTTTRGTLVQFIHGLVDIALGTAMFDRYRWVSIIDAVTTDICRSRNGNIYVYGEGPIPPAHYNCRSHTVPVLFDTPAYTPPNNFYVWLKTQPDNLLNSLLGTRRANLWRKNNVDYRDIPALSLDDYKRAGPFLTAE